MKRIAVVDDRIDDRRYIVEALNDAIDNEKLRSEWEVIELDPLAQASEYPAWINDCQIDILIIDERLFEASTGLLTPGYLGSDVVEQVRHTHKKLPILGISADTNTKEFNERFGLFDDIIIRDELTQDPVAYLKRFTRKAENLLEDNRENLAELSTLSAKIATGTATEGDVKNAQSIQEALSIPLTVTSMSRRQEWINEYAKQVEELEAIRQKMSELVERSEADK